MVKFYCKKENNDFIIDIKHLKNTEEILIQCNDLNRSSIYSSFYNLQKLRDMDVIFYGSNSSSEAFSVLCKYFNDNKPDITLCSKTKIIIEIYKDVEPDWKFELKNDLNNNLEEEILIGGSSDIKIFEGLEPNLNDETLNLRVVQPKFNQIDGEKKKLNYILKFLLLKEIVNQIENLSPFEDFLSKEIIWILEDIKANKNSLENKNLNSEINILNYLNYLKFLDEYYDLDLYCLIEQIIEIVGKKNEIENYWKYLSKYEEYNNEFDFLKDLKNCHFDYSIISMNIVERENPEKYEQKKKECKNMKRKILYHGSGIIPNSNGFNMKLEYTDKSAYGEDFKGFYFSDSIDNISSLKYNGNIPNIGETFSFIVCEIFYDEEKLKIFENKDLYQESSQNDILKVEDIVEPNGLIKIENYYDYDYDDNEIYIKDNKKGIFHNLYILSQNYQILPLYIFTLKRNEYFVLYRDPNFIGRNKYTVFLKIIQNTCYKLMKNMNIYFEGCTEEALKFLLKRKNQKVILITSIGFASGKRFVEIARKIYGFNLLVLFFSSAKNKKKNSEWIKKFPNCLYITKGNLYQDYITKYNEKDLKELRKKDEEDNNINLMEFSFNFMEYTNCHSDINYNSLKYINKFPYFRKVYILCPKKNLYLGMTKEGKVEKSEQACSWYITLLEYKITFFSNGFYLNINNEKDEMPLGSEYMEEWDIEIISEVYYYIINTKYNNKKKYLSMENEGIIANKNEPDDNTKFKFIDILEY